MYNVNYGVAVKAAEVLILAVVVLSVVIICWSVSVNSLGRGSLSDRRRSSVKALPHVTISSTTKGCFGFCS